MPLLTGLTGNVATEFLCFHHVSQNKQDEHNTKHGSGEPEHSAMHVHTHESGGVSTE